MALVMIRKPKHFAQDGLWFDVTIASNTISVLHSQRSWSGYGDTSFLLRAGPLERSSFQVDETYQCVLFTLEQVDEVVLVVGKNEVLLKDI